MPRNKPNKYNIVQPKRTAGSGSSGLGSLRNFTNAQDIQNRFWNNAASRRQIGDKASGDAGYWTNGRCNWGGSHNLTEDSQTLAQWANNIVSIQYDTQELTLAINEQEFNQKKQAPPFGGGPAFGRLSLTKFKIVSINPKYQTLDQLAIFAVFGVITLVVLSNHLLTNFGKNYKVNLMIYKPLILLIRKRLLS